MDEDKSVGRDEGAAVGVERAAGRSTGSESSRDAGRQRKGRAGVAAAKVQEAIDRTAERLTDGLSATTARTHAAVDRAYDGVQKVADRVDPFVTHRPYATLGIGVAAGLVLGLLLAGRPKIVYVKPRA